MRKITQRAEDIFDLNYTKARVYVKNNGIGTVDAMQFAYDGAMSKRVLNDIEHLIITSKNTLKIMTNLGIHNDESSAVNTEALRLMENEIKNIREWLI